MQTNRTRTGRSGSCGGESREGSREALIGGRLAAWLGNLCLNEIALRYAEVGRRSAEPFERLRGELWSREGLLGTAERRASWAGRSCEPDVERIAVGPVPPLRLLLVETGRRLTRLALELSAAAGRDGRYPSDLVSLPSVAADPVTGEMPRYELRADGSAVLAYAAAAEIDESIPRRRRNRVGSLRLELPAPGCLPPG